MSLADTYLLASKARSKLTREASRNDHDLRILVSHANMLDNLMDSLAQRRYQKQQQQQQPQVQPILTSSQTEQPSYPAPTFDLAKPQHIETIEHEINEEYDDDDYSDDDTRYSEEEEEEEDEEEYYEDEDEEDYSMFEDCQLPSSRIYQTRNKQYKVLPTVDEAPLEEEEEEEEDYYEEQAVRGSFQIELHSTQSTIITSVAVVEVEDEDEEESDYSSPSSPSSPSSEVPSLCYSSESESEDESKDDDNNSFDEEGEETDESNNNKLELAFKSTAPPSLSVIEQEGDDESVKVIAPKTCTPNYYSNKCLILRSSEQLDLLIH